MFTVRPLLTLISDCESTTGWTGGAVTNDSFQLEGTFCLGEKVSSTGTPVASSEHVFTFAANVDMTDQVIIIPMSITGAAATLAQGGYRMIVDDGNGDRWKWYVGGSDTTNERWTYFALDPATIPEYLNGAANAAKAVTSITGTGTTKTVTTTAAHGMATGDYVTISGATNAGYNVRGVPITVLTTTTFTYTGTAGGSPATGTIILHQTCDYTDVDKVGCQMAVVTKAVGNTPNVFFDICHYGDGMQITSIVDTGAHTLTRVGTTVSFVTATVLDENVDSSSITFNATGNVISDSNNGLGIFKANDKISITGTTGGSNDGIFTVTYANPAAGSLAVLETLTTQASSSGTTKIERSHNMSNGDQIVISGASPSTYNGIYNITNVNAAKTTFDYVVPTAPASSPATGSAIVAAELVTWAKVAAVDAANYWGLITELNGVFFLQGQFVLGSLTAVNEDLYMVDSNFICVFKNNLFVPFAANNIISTPYQTADLTVINFQDAAIAAAEGTQWAWASTADVDNVTLLGMQMDNSDVFAIAGSTSVVTASTFNNYNQIFLSGAFFYENNLKNSKPGSFGLVLGTLDTVDARVYGLNFTNVASDGYAVTVNAADRDRTFDSYVTDFSGSADLLWLNGAAAAVAPSSITRVGTLATLTTSAAHTLSTGDHVIVVGATPAAYNGQYDITVLNSTQFTYVMASDPGASASPVGTWEELIEVSLINGANFATFLGSPGGEVDFVSSVPVTVTVVEAGTGTPIENANVQIYLTSDYATSVINAGTNSSGIVTVSYGGTTPVGIEGWARQVDLLGTDYEPKNFVGTIAAGTGFSLTVELEPSS